MITSKQLWKTIYELIKYSHYELEGIDDQHHDITLRHQKSGEIIRFVTEKQNVQSLSFLIQRMIDHQDSNYITIYLVNQDGPSIQQNMQVTVKPLHSKGDLTVIQPSLLRQLTERQQPKSENFYKSKVMSTQFVDKAMIQFSPVTMLLILLNVLVFIFSLISRWRHDNNFVDQGGLSHFNFIHGDYYRILTSMFLHLDFQHLLFNMLSLFIFGKLINYLYGTWKYIVIYLTGGIIGNLISLSFDTASTSVGASGAITALLGALLAYFVFSGKFDRKFIFQTIAGMIIFLLISNLFGRVNNFAHFGGLFGGFLIATMLYLFVINRRYFYMTLAGVGIIIILLLVNIFSQPENHIYNEAAQQEMKQGDFKAADVILQDTFKHGYEDAESYQLYGLVKANDDSLNEAVTTWKKGLKVFPSSDILNYQMALAMRAEGNYRKAATYIDKAIEVNPLNRYKTLKKEIKVFGE